VYSEFPYAYRILGYSYARSGQRNKASAILARFQELSKKRYVALTNFSTIELALGHKDRALALFEQARRERDPTCFWAKVAREVDAVRDEPEYQTAIEEIGLPD
jgi:Flp pilus assembly protein TadD